MTSVPLPIEPALPAACAALAGGKDLVLAAPPGAGKTTRLPIALLAGGLLDRGALWLLQPRRVAARAAAARLAASLGEEVGSAVGLVTRDERRLSPRSRIVVVTEGVLTRRLLDDPDLPGVAAVMLDEFHERSRHADLGLAMLREVRATLREDLRVVVASATLDAAPVAAFLGAETLAVEGRAHPVALVHADRPDDRPLALGAASAVRRALAETAGDVLVFLPGAAEIRRTGEALAGEPGVVVLPLHGDLPARDQDAALRPAPGGLRKVVLATNVAETSLTIEGVSAVVDSGLARVPRYDPRSGLDRLVEGRISRASAVQRAGRAGRLGPGTAYRLYTAHDERGLVPAEQPEVLRTDAAGTLLPVLLWAARPPEEFAWLDPPPRPLVERGLDLLRQLGAIERASLAPTAVGRAMGRIPLHPRLAAIVLAGAREGLLREGALLAALLDERDVLAGARAFAGGDRGSGGADVDLADRALLVEEAERGGLAPPLLARLGLDPGTVRRVLRLRDLAAAAAGGTPRPGRDAASGGGDRHARMRRLLLAGYPDRIARRKGPGAGAAVLAGGLPVAVDGRSGAGEAPLLLVLETAGTRSGTDRVSRASAVDEAWLEPIEEATTVAWDAVVERVVARRERRFGALVLSASEVPAPLDGTTAALLAEAASRDLARALDLGGPVAALRARVAFLAAAMPELGLSLLDDDALRALLPELAQGRRRLDELREAPLLPLLRAHLGPRALRALAEHAPEAVEVPTGRSLPLRYGDREGGGNGPVLAVKLQELFGLPATPRVAAGRVPVLLHLLSPAGRPVQVTSDLTSFWETTYPSVRRELRGRYPKHPWPEDPWNAPPQRGTVRSGR